MYGRSKSYELLPIFLDVHDLPFSEDHLKEFFKSPIDEFGVRHINYFYDKGTNVCFCLLEAPDSVAVENHHYKAGVKKCEWILEVPISQSG